jgi:hypothetical protein
MLLSIARGNGIKTFRAVTKIDALIWGAQRRNKKKAPAGEPAGAQF